MTWTIHETSNPYFDGAVTSEDGTLVIRMAVDQLWIDPDTNEQQILKEYYEEAEQ